jgi:hypothetical protein
VRDIRVEAVFAEAEFDRGGEIRGKERIRASVMRGWPCISARE